MNDIQHFLNYLKIQFLTLMGKSSESQQMRGPSGNQPKEKKIVRPRKQRKPEFNKTEREQMPIKNQSLEAAENNLQIIHLEDCQVIKSENEIKHTVCEENRVEKSQRYQIVAPLNTEPEFHESCLLKQGKRKVKKQGSAKKQKVRVKQQKKTTRKSRKSEYSSQDQKSKLIQIEQNDRNQNHPKLQIQINTQNLPDIVCSAYGIYDKDLLPIIQNNSTKPLPIASITKLMTLLTVIRIMEVQCGLTFKQLSSIYVRITVQASRAGGSSSELTPKEWMTIHDLLYGAIVPSGNDASLALAHALGGLLQNRQKFIGEIKKKKQLDVTISPKSKIDEYQVAFIEYMNKLAIEDLCLANSQFANPHGLDNPHAYSCVQDILKLTSAAYSNQFCRQILATKKFNGKLNIFPGKNGCPTDTDWINTDKLLWKAGYVGGKTGHTPEAGSCLTTIYQPLKDRPQQIYYIIVLGCQKEDDRFSNTQKLVNNIFSIS